MIGKLTITHQDGTTLALGATGLRGPTGLQGPVGARGFPGPTGPSGDSVARAVTPPALEIDGAITVNFAPDGWDTETTFFVHCADNEGSRFASFGDLPDNTIRELVNTASPVDAGVGVFLHKSAYATSGIPIKCPNDRDCLMAKGGSARIIIGPDYNGDRFWWPMVSDTRQLHIATHSLNVHPHLYLPPLVGQVNNWNPTAIAAMSDTPYPSGKFTAGVSGRSRDGSGWILSTQTGADVVVTGIDWGGGHTSTDPADHGPVKFIYNLGPGRVVLPHAHTDSDLVNRIRCPNDKTIYLSPDSGVIIISRQMGGWQVMVPGTQPIQFIDLLHLAQMVYGVPVTIGTALPGGGHVTHNWNPWGVALDVNGNGMPTSSTVVAFTAGGTERITSIVGPGAGNALCPEITVLNFGGVFDWAYDDQINGLIGNRLYLPGAADFSQGLLRSTTFLYHQATGHYFLKGFT